MQRMDQALPSSEAVEESNVIELAKRLVAHPKWKWRDGMAMKSARVWGRCWRKLDDDGQWANASHYSFEEEGNSETLAGAISDGLPDLKDPGTYGALFDLLWEDADKRFGGNASVSLSMANGGWVATAGHQGHAGRFSVAADPGQAIATALLDAWGPA